MWIGLKVLPPRAGFTRLEEDFGGVLLRASFTRPEAVKENRRTLGTNPVDQRHVVGGQPTTLSGELRI